MGVEGSSSNAESSAEVSGLTEIHTQFYRFLEDDRSVRAFIFSLIYLFILT